MAVTTDALFLRIAPELATDNRASDFLADAASELNAAKWGTRYARGFTYLAAHLMTVSPLDGEGADTAGPVTQKSAADVSETYAPFSYSKLSLGDAVLATTRYGREFLRLRSGLGGPVLVDVYNGSR